MAAVFPTKCPLGCKFSILARVVFDAKWGCIYMYAAPFCITSICNINGVTCHLQQSVGQNAPKRSAKCTKMQCKMQQNAG